MDNLQTLCKAHNKEKGGDYIRDYRKGKGGVFIYLIFDMVEK